jgi:NADH-quinone oxidoreductase subunit L
MSRWDFSPIPLSSLMLLFVTFIGLLIHIYSIGYMAGDQNFGKFFAYLNLFLGSMLILVLGDGPVVMFVGWEGVGLCSYLLISYYSEDRTMSWPATRPSSSTGSAISGSSSAWRFLFWGIGAGGFDYLSLKANAHQLVSRRWAPCIVCLCSLSAPAANRPRFLCMSGCPTPWPAQPRSRP